MSLADKSYFPHLRADEIDIFKRWLLKHETEWKQYDFDIRVGKGVGIEGNTDNITEGFRRLTQKRIDVVAKRPGELLIIEIRPRADHTAVGNLLAYRTLFISDFKPSEKIGMLVISDRVGDDDKAVMESLNIGWEVV